MSKIVETKLKIESWDEKPYREEPDSSKFTRADVLLSGIGDELTAGGFEALMYYRPDGTGTYLSYLRLTGTLDGRSGSFVLQGTGEYDGTSARSESRVVPGSATGDLAGLTGTGMSVSTHADYPFMPFTLEYELA